MSVLDLYFSPPSQPLFGRHGRGHEPLVVFGIPFDSAATRIPGQRFAPRRIREVSVELETFSPELNMYVEELEYFDAGDLPLTTEFSVLRDIVSKTVREFIETGKTPLALGGDHLVSYPLISEIAFNLDELLVVVFDAHMDLRDEYPLGTRFSHATVMRRLLENNEKISIAYFKPRGFSREEYELARTEKRIFIVEDIQRLEQLLGSYRNIYVSLDIDALDPAFAPGTGTPEPMGLTPHGVVEALRVIAGQARSLVGFDLVEVNPMVDCNDITSLLAGKLVMELLFSLKEKEKDGKAQQSQHGE
ncbi:agmatinase [Infirmifilum uzonense]|uniref:agmatinase n=1 Tax=Infirmifilum uzonense TaxID=1550241 RepID=UPI00168D5C13|nr:agmatinase [Infirmifilum uzonense]